jgi:hypothetical protein
MPWLPEFTSALEQARLRLRAQGLADPAAQYLNALSRDESGALETVWPGEVVVQDPYRGEVRGHRGLRRFIHDNHAWFAARQARVETVASISTRHRAVLELLVHLVDDEQGAVEWPIAVVADSPDDLSVTFRSYCSQSPVTGHRNTRPAFLTADSTEAADIVEDCLAALSAGDAEAVAGMFTDDGYYREATGPDGKHQGAALQPFLAQLLRPGGIDLRSCSVTDDGGTCVVEWNCGRWRGEDIPAQAGLTAFERAPDGRLAAVRSYNDLEPASHDD